MVAVHDERSRPPHGPGDGTTRPAPASPAVEEARVEVMSSSAHVVVVGGEPGGAAWAVERIRSLEACWTRFAPSELTRLNATSGEPVDVSLDLLALVEASRTAWEATGGRFDPTVIDALEAQGYDRSITELDRAATSDPGDVPQAPGSPRTCASPGLGGVFVWRDLRRVMLPNGVRIDPGGIGKGLAADLVVDELIARGAEGALVNLGGDTRVAGRAPRGGEWVVSIEDPRHDGVELARICLRDGGVATSSRLRRRWRHEGHARHHLIDPETGCSTTTDVVGATAVAGTAWWAEATTKALVVAGSDPGLAALDAASAIVVCDDGTVRTTPDLRDALRT